MYILALRGIFLDLAVRGCTPDSAVGIRPTVNSKQGVKRLEAEGWALARVKKARTISSNTRCAAGSSQ